MTLTDFELHTLTEPSDQDDTVGEEAEDADYQQPPPDSAEFVARKIVDCIRTGDAEVYAHDWMKPAG